MESDGIKVEQNNCYGYLEVTIKQLYLTDKNLPSKVSVKCVYRRKFKRKWIIHEKVFTLCDYIYMGNTHQIFRKRIGVYFSDVQSLLKNGQKSELFAVHFKQQFKSITPPMEWRKRETFKVVKQINPIREIGSFTKPNLIYVCKNI